MAHELSFIDGKAEFAYLESDGPAWHGFGQPLPDGSDRAAWGIASNLDGWTIRQSPVLFYDEETDSVQRYDREKVLYRSDLMRPLATVGTDYHVVQPSEVLDFFTDLTEALGFRLCTAGTLFNGRKYWAQAYAGNTFNIGNGDSVRDKILISTSCDGSLATTVQRVAERVVCNNTLRMALNEKGDRFRVTHGIKFDPAMAKTALGLDPSLMAQWGELAQRMADKRISESAAFDFFGRAFDLYEAFEDTADGNELQAQQERLALASGNRAANSCFELFKGAGRGSELVTASGTLWGALNAVTEYVDHGRKTRTFDARLDSAYFGQFAKVKDRAWDEAVLMVA